jgi:HSP20 family molecular chaperone IbpA
MTTSDRDELRDLQEARPSSDEERQARRRRRNFARPPVDIYATDTEMVVLADMPGVQKGDLDITLERDELIIEARAAGREKEESALPWGYYRRFKLRTAFDRNRIQASLKGGVLRITLPKAPSERPQKVAVD